MSLPPALLERLKRRKIIQDSSDRLVTSSRKDPDTTKSAKLCPSARISTNAKRNKEENDEDNEEEIIAEDYSDDEQAEQPNDDSDEHDSDREIQTSPTTAAGHKNRAEQIDESDDSFLDSSQTTTTRPGAPQEADTDEDSRAKQLLSSEDHKSLLGCPNKYNIYHICSQYCKDKYADINEAHVDPSKKQRKQLALLIKTFPMSNDWTPVYDPGLRTFYFWNIITNHVSWLPPGMSGFASPSADQIRKSYIEATSHHESNDQVELE